ncbi:Cupin domain protein [Mycolicibacterium chlorophenolicum]|uniref:Cupin domain protein n=1 Tax=Mycolicibacterium chlorophenolicum TaxID=37916 RepID=A0A0J6VB70_9MYCO|nr:Cupin domain protein [Mycolicibacterium chlorophenolicum]
MPYHISRAADRVFSEVKGIPGLTEAIMVGEEHGSHHMEVSLRKLEAGATIGWHRSPFEESWVIRGGSGRVSLAGLVYDLGVGDYGVAPVGLTHSLTAGDGGLEYFCVKAPKPPNFEGARSQIAAPPIEGENLGRPSESDPRHRFVGHFEESDMGPVHDLNMPGYHGPNIKNIYIRMMVDQLLGAQHHTVFMAKIAAGSGPGRAAKVHYHPFEEIYYFIDGGMHGWLDGNEETTETGDLVWVSTDGTHGFINENNVDARWIEVQSPVPPTSDAFFFPDDWKNLPEHTH